MRISAPSAAGHAGDAGSLLYRTLQIPPKTAVLSVGLLFCPFCFCCGWLACCAILAFFALVFGLLARARARARPQPQNAAIYGVLLHLRFRPGLRAALFGLLFWVLWRARARDPMSAFWVGARMGPRKPASPALSGVKVGNMHNLTSHIIAHATFLMQKT